MKKARDLLCAVLAVCMTAMPVYADVLGSVVEQKITDMADNTYLYNTVFESAQNGVGKQTEYYVEYNPNSQVVPVVINGEALWGTRTIIQAMSYMSDNGLKPLIGINADYFSFKTGIPMGTSIMDGEIATSASGYIDAVGFRADGSGFISGLNLKTEISHNGETASAECINKWYTPDYTPICILTDKFGRSTKTTSDCLFVMCRPDSGKLAVGETMTLTVEDKFETPTEVAIPKGKIMLVINKTGYEREYNFLNSMSVGDSVSITNTAMDDSYGMWNGVQNAIGTSAGRLIANGKIGSGFEEGSAPRTAVGVKADGTIVFYVLDGRQKGYSYGARAQTVAQRLLEIGCVDALNLDGGGSTAMAGIFPGSSEYSVINSPSDGGLRSCANYIFLKDSRVPTGIAKTIITDNKSNKNFISGASAKFNITAVYDTGGYAMNGLGDARIEIENQNGGKSYMDSDNVIHFEGSGIVDVNVVGTDGRTIYSERYESFDTPDSIKIYDQNTWKEISEIYCPSNGGYSADLTAAPYIGETELNTQDDAFEWSVTGDIGTIDEYGRFTLAENGGMAGKIIIEKGGFKKEINVYREGYNGETETGFDDIAGHWAYDTILAMADEGVINGYEENGKRYFKPDAYMTRAEFAKMICGFIGLDESDYSAETLQFSDSSDIPLWAVNSVKAMQSTGIIKGRADGEKYIFAPYDNITRAEAMTVMGRIIESDKTEELNFKDNSDIPDWARESMEKLLGAGVIRGYNDNTIHPNDNMKRAEAAVMLSKIER